MLGGSRAAWMQVLCSPLVLSLLLPLLLLTDDSTAAAGGGFSGRPVGVADDTYHKGHNNRHGRKPYPKTLPPAASTSGRVFRMAAGADPPLPLQSDGLAVSLDPQLPRVISYTFLKTNQSFAAAVHGWGYHPAVKLNGGAVTCGEAGMATVYSRLSPAAVNWTLTLSCTFNYPTLVSAESLSPPTGPVVVVMQGSISLVDEAALQTQAAEAETSPATTQHASEDIDDGRALCSGTPNLACELSARDQQVFPELGSGIQIVAQTAAECCQLCQAHSNCTAWNWNGPKGNMYCYGLTGCSKTKVGGGDTCQCGSDRPLPKPPPTPPPTPPHPPPPPTPPAPPPHSLPASHMDWQLNFVNCSEASVPVRSLDLIGFEFLTLLQDDTGAQWPPSPPAPTMWGGNRRPCGGADNKTGNCLDYNQMHMKGKKAIWYSPGDYLANHRKGPVTPSQTYTFEDCSQNDIDGDTGGCSVSSGVINRNAPAGSEVGCFEGPRSMHAAGPERGNTGGGWSSDGRTGVSLISSQKNKGLQSGLRHYDVPTRCQMYNFASRSVTIGTRCGDQLPFAMRVGFFGDLTEDGKITRDDIYLYNRRQFPDADAMYYQNMVFKLGLDYHSYYQLPCEPPSIKQDGCGGCPGCGPPTIAFNQTLDWLKNYSLLVDGLPMTPILVGWQGNGHDSLYPGLDVVNSYLGGSAGLNNLVADAKRLYNATISYHIDVDISNSMTPTEHYQGPYSAPTVPYDASVPNPEFELSSMRTNADHATPFCMNSTYWTTFWPKAGM